MKLLRYKLTLFFNTFPSFSLSALFTSIFVQPRLFSLPFLLFEPIKLKLNKWSLLLLINIVMAIFIPLVGFFFNRQISLLDLAYILSAVYAYLFVNATINKIDLFNKFIRFILLINICYVFIQVILYYLNLSQFTMIHSNLPMQVEDQYSIPSGILFNFPRYSGLFIESGPFTFYLCLTYLYLLQQGVNFSIMYKVIVLSLIVLSQSKYLLIFVPVLLFESIFNKAFPRIYRTISRPLFAFMFTMLSSWFLLALIFSDFEIIQYLSATIPAFELRLEGIKYSLRTLFDLKLFGEGLLPSTFTLTNATFELAGLDAFSIVILGYGLYGGAIILSSFIMFPVLANIRYKYTFIAVLILGFLSSGSLLIPQYLFAITYTILAHNQNILFQKKKINRLIS